MVWGALSRRGFYLTIVPNKVTVNSDRYIEILQTFLPYANEIYPDGWILQQDGATPHTSRKTQEWTDSENIQILQ